MKLADGFQAMRDIAGIAMAEKQRGPGLGRRDEPAAQRDPVRGREPDRFVRQTRLRRRGGQRAFGEIHQLVLIEVEQPGNDGITRGYRSKH